MKFQIQYTDIPVLLADKHKIDIHYTGISVIIANKHNIKTLEMRGSAANLFQQVKLHQSKISRKINNFIKKKIAAEIVDDFLEIFWDAVENDRSVVETLSELKELYNTIPPKPIYSTGRSASRVKDINKWLNSLKRKKDVKYLDVGCSEASITETIANALNLKMGDIYGCDIFIIEEPGGKVIFTPSTPTSLPYKDGEFDLVTTFQALHHFNDPDIMLSEIHRVLKPRGAYIIREHDVRDPSFGVYLDVVHALYSVVINSEKTPESFVTTYESFYHNKEAWSRDYIVPAGFKFAGLVKTNDQFNSYYARYFKV